MKRARSPLARRIKGLRDYLCFSQAQFADKVGVTQATVSAWEKGDKERSPSAEAFFRLGSLAKLPQDKVYFWGLGGLDEQSILEAAESISNMRRKPEPGEIVRLPRYGIEGLGLRRTGGDVPLPAEFVPNPGSTICLSAKGAASASVRAPRGLYIVDRSARGSDRLGDLLHRVVVLSFAARDDLIDEPSGIYVGRIWTQPGAWRDRGAVRFHQRWSLVMLSSGITSHHVQLCADGAVLPFAIDEGEGSPRGPAIGNLFDWLDGHPKQRKIFDKVRADLIASARVPPGSQVLGEVIGRLSGRVAREAATGGDETAVPDSKGGGRNEP